MARRFAELDDNDVVLRVIVADNKEWCEQNLGGIWVETEKYKKDTHNYAGIGYVYDRSKKNFRIKRPFPSWILDDKLKWKAPKEMPTDRPTKWDENKKDWVSIY